MREEIEAIKERIEAVEKLRKDIMKLLAKIMEVNSELTKEIAEHYRDKIAEIVKSVAESMGFGVKAVFICDGLDTVVIAVVTTEVLTTDEAKEFTRKVNDELARIKPFREVECRPQVEIFDEVEEVEMTYHKCY